MVSFPILLSYILGTHTYMGCSHHFLHATFFYMHIHLDFRDRPNQWIAFGNDSSASTFAKFDSKPRQHLPNPT
jgi:hypothetical protein